MQFCTINVVELRVALPHAVPYRAALHAVLMVSVDTSERMTGRRFLQILMIDV